MHTYVYILAWSHLALVRCLISTPLTSALHVYRQEIIHIRYPTAPRGISASLHGISWRVEYFDLLDVDVSYSHDRKSFDARAVLRSTYHRAFLERGLASLPEPVEEPACAAPAAAQATPRAVYSAVERAILALGDTSTGSARGVIAS